MVEETKVKCQKGVRKFGINIPTKVDAKDKLKNLTLLKEVGANYVIVRNRLNILRWCKEILPASDVMEIIGVTKDTPIEEKRSKFLQFVGVLDTMPNPTRKTSKNSETSYLHYVIDSFWTSEDIKLCLCAYNRNNKPIWAWQLCSGMIDVHHPYGVNDSRTETINYHTHQYDLHGVEGYLHHQGISMRKYDTLLQKVKKGEMTKEEAVKEIRTREKGC